MSSHGPQPRKPRKAKGGSNPEKKRKPVWEDDGEEDFPAKRPLVEENMPNWAIPQMKGKKNAEEGAEGEEGSDEDEERAIEEAVDEMLRSTGRLTAVRGAGRLPADSLAVVIKSDVNAASKSFVSPTCVAFHPSVTSKVVLVASPDNHVKLFRLEPKRNRLLQSIHIRNVQPMQAVFDPTGAKIYVSGGKGTCCIIDSTTFEARFVSQFLRNHKYERDLPTFGLSPEGKHLAFVNPTGRCFVVASHTFTPIASMKMGELLNDVAFDPDNANYMYLCGGGKVYTWDLRNTQEPLSHFRDDGAFDCKRVAVSHAHVAVGSNVGIVNVYNKPVGGCFTSATPTPLKILKNVVVPINHLRFNHDGQLLFFGARAKGQARMANMGTMTVFPNFPGPLTSMSCMAMDFSPDSTFFAYGTLDCRVMLGKLSHYSSAKREAAQKAHKKSWVG